MIPISLSLFLLSDQPPIATYFPSPIHQEPLPLHIIKIFYGPSKGIHIEFNFGGVFQDHKGNILHIYATTLANENNNYVKKYTLEFGLLVSIYNIYPYLLVEGDSH